MIGGIYIKREKVLFEASEKISMYLKFYQNMPEGRQKEILHTSTFIEGLVYRCILDVLDKYSIKRRNDRVLFSDYITDAALKQLEQGNRKGLVREHIVPKIVYFSIMIAELKKGLLTQKRIYNLLNDYYWACLVTKEENDSLNKNFRSTMPNDWDGKNTFARYEKVSIVGVTKNERRILQ